MEDNKVTETKNEEGDDDVLSLCDFPYATHQSNEGSKKDDNTPLVAVETQQDDSDFIFCTVSSNEPEMCVADEVFYHGRILPYYNNIRPASNSDDRFSSGGRIPSSSRRSAGGGGGGEHPKTRCFANKQRTVRFSARKKSSAWDIFRPGLIISQPAEIGFQDLKNRYHRNSRNCGEKKKKKMKRRNFLIGGCRCCANDAVDAVRAKVVVIKRGARDGGNEVPVDELNLLRRPKGV